MIDMRVRADDGLYGEFVPAQKLQDTAHFIAGINDQRLSRHRIADDRAIALQYPHRNGDVDKSLFFHTDNGSSVTHVLQYSITTQAVRGAPGMCALLH